MSRFKSGVVGIFPSLDSLLSGVRQLKDGGFRVERVYSPTRTEEITDIMEGKPSPVRYFTLTGAITGALFGFGLANFAALKWSFIVWGKPPVVIVPYVVIAFEFCILFAVFATLIGIAVQTRLPSLRLPPDYDPRFSRDHYGAVVPCGDQEKGRVRQIILRSGAADVKEF
jgi:molybdopterin-containing oxidoreductase family membrane subunit